MLTTAPGSNQLKEKRRVLKKANRLSRPFAEDFIVVEMEGEAGSAELSVKVASLPSTETASNETPEKLAGRSVPHSHESLADARRSSAISGQSLFTVEDSTSSETDSQTALTSVEQLRRGKAPRLNRQLGENVPPAQTKRRQSIDSTIRATGASPDLKRTHSLWAHQNQKRREALDDAAGEFQDRYLRNFGTGTMSERQRALNVCCDLLELDLSNLVVQLFGQEPPPELIQIHDERGNSTATLSTLLTVTPPLRDRANSTSSVGTANDVEMDIVIPSTPPPFATVHAVDAPEPSTVPTSSFQERRRRAAKLSRFFGVGFQDILLPSGPESAPPIPETKVEVAVKVSGQRRFWSFNDRPKDGDMQEAIEKLRGLKAS
ncbi:hypothetical protein B0H13DRAFT_1990512 [Mycena leptocephala]|nr:hypothetical protein B0H13DRAFT_1990512 [Mycena leptocephala]